MVDDMPVVVPYTVLVLPYSGVDMEPPPEHMIRRDEAVFVYHSLPSKLHCLWLPWRICEGRQNKYGRGEAALKPSDANRLFLGGFGHGWTPLAGVSKVVAMDLWQLDNRRIDYS